MKRMPLGVVLFFLLVTGWVCTAQAEPIDVLIKGIYDGKKVSRDLAYKNAVMNAKIQAIERAGAEISSITQVENFTMKYDMVESRAKALILPGFQIIDIGYQTDGTYVVVLGGKVQVGPSKGKLWGQLRTAPRTYTQFKEAFEAWQASFPGSVDNQYVNNENGTIIDLKTGLMWMYSYQMAAKESNVEEMVRKMNQGQFAGQSDWRSPTLDEIASIFEVKGVKSLDSGRKSHLDPIFDANPYCWYLWSADSTPEGKLLAYVGEDRGGISIAGDHFQADGICVACFKAVRSMK